MKSVKPLYAVAAAFVIAMFFIAAPVKAASGLIKVDGSSTVYPITEAVAEEIQKATKGEI